MDGKHERSCHYGKNHQWRRVDQQTTISDEASLKNCRHPLSETWTLRVYTSHRVDRCAHQANQVRDQIFQVHAELFTFF
jgi:hypothetical protein